MNTASSAASPISVGGKRQIVNVRPQDYETGRYSRDGEGQWKMRGVRISHFDQLDYRPLAETVDRLPAVTRKVALDQDIFTKLAAFRHGSSGT